MNIRNLWTPTYTRPKERWSRFTWGELQRGWSPLTIKVSGWHDDRATLILGLFFAAFYINLPKINHLCGQGIDGGSYGFYFYDDALVLCWQKHNLFLHYPWSWTFHKHEVMARTWSNNIDWLLVPRSFFGKEFAKKWQAPYTYTLNNGTVQRRIATYYVERRTWRWRWLKWLPFPRMVRTSIDVEFNAEVGERSGSWKGGTTGCSYDMLSGETPHDTLRRMERERKFK